ncbi:hypothetical protein V6Z11_D05G046500 [Gossypium hirsutum]
MEKEKWKQNRQTKTGEKGKQKKKGSKGRKFGISRFQAQLLMSCKSHCPRKERRR